MQGADTPHIEPALTMLWNSDDYSAGFRECLNAKMMCQRNMRGQDHLPNSSTRSD